MNRRNFIRTLGAAGASTLPLSTLQAANGQEEEEFRGILVDTTRCLGCRNCERACAEAHGLPDPPPDDDIFKSERTTSTTQWTVVNRYETEKGEVFVKRQCMHCSQPACASACLTKAMLKTEEGPVIWRESKCMGCRFCMVSCPFNVPRFEYDSPIPKIQKCNMCWDRLEEGKLPACVEACPAQAIVFGKRSDLIEEAHRQIFKDPDSYVHTIYGEYEAGGTGYMYIASVPFDQLGFNTKLDDTAYPEFTTGYLYAVPIILALWPTFLLGVSNATKKDHDESREE